MAEYVMNYVWFFLGGTGEGGGKRRWVVKEAFASGGRAGGGGAGRDCMLHKTS